MFPKDGWDISCNNLSLQLLFLPLKQKRYTLPINERKWGKINSYCYTWLDTDEILSLVTPDQPAFYKESELYYESRFIVNISGISPDYQVHVEKVNFIEISKLGILTKLYSSLKTPP